MVAAGKDSDRRDVSVALLCHDIAYSILPDYAHRQYEKLETLCHVSPEMAGPFFYVLACKDRELEPDRAFARDFYWEYTCLGRSQSPTLTLVFPPPPPVEALPAASHRLLPRAIALGPHFATVVEDPRGRRHYYVLSQSPSGGTSLHQITFEGILAPLGVGPAPTLEAFYETLTEHLGHGRAGRGGE